MKQAPEGSIHWDELPYDEPKQGEEVSGYVAGAIEAFTGEKVAENLVECLGNQETLLDSFQASAESIMKRYNDDVVDGVAHLRTVYMGLESAVEGCKKETQTLTQGVSAKITKVDENTILTNLADKKNHVELLMAKMKMTDVAHEFDQYGVYLGELYLTLATTQ